MRPTVIHNLKRAGWPMSEIMKLTGHRSLETVIRSYDSTIDTSDKVDMSAAIGLAARLSRGEIKEASGIYFFKVAIDILPILTKLKLLTIMFCHSLAYFLIRGLR